MADRIKCTCSNCGAKYRLPVEAQGRTARCKRCGQAFRVPQVQSLEDTVMSWLALEDDDDELEQPRVISIPAAEETDEGTDKVRRMRGPIRMKDPDKPSAPESK